MINTSTDMKINVDLLIVLSELYKAVPFRTPHRINVIYEFADAIWKSMPQPQHDLCNKECVINLRGEDYFSADTEFKMSIDNILRLEHDIPKLTLSLPLSGKSDRILIPTTYYCCGYLLNIIPYYASMPLYTNNGIVSCRSYHSKCRVCKVNYYHGFKEDKNGKNREFEDINQLDVFLFNSGIAFTLQFVRYVDKMICIGAVNFEKIAEIYKSLHSVEVNADRIETCWFLYRILHHITIFEEWPRKNKNKELDVERLCGLVYNSIKDKLHKKALEHICDEIGCKERFIVIDGNEKLFRALCAAKPEKIISVPGEVNRYNVCIANPLRGVINMQRCLNFVTNIRITKSLHLCTHLT